MKNEVFDETGLLDDETGLLDDERLDEHVFDIK
jgi:hypothetical protein